jgi:hypothetical protein
MQRKTRRRSNLPVRVKKAGFIPAFFYAIFRPGLHEARSPMPERHPAKDSASFAPAMRNMRDGFTIAC